MGKIGKGLVFLAAVATLWTGVARSLTCPEIVDPLTPSSLEEFAQQGKLFGNLASVEEYAEIGKESAKEKVEFIQHALEKNGVESTIRVESSWFGLKKHWMVAIEPGQTSHMNKLAARLKENFGAEVVFDPGKVDHLGWLNGGTQGGHRTKDNRIYLSEYNALTGRPDKTFFHEVRHAAMTASEKQKKYDMVNGEYLRINPFSRKWPFGRGKSGYGSYINMQELKTSLQDHEYTALLYKKLLRKSEITTFDMTGFVSQLDFSAIEVLDDLRNLIDYEIEIFKSGRGMLGISNGTLGMMFFGWDGFISLHNVPRKFFSSRLPDSLRTASEKDWKAYIKTAEGKSRIRAIAVEYLKELHRITDERAGRLNHERDSLELMNSLIARASLKDGSEQDQMYRKILEQFFVDRLPVEELSKQWAQKELPETDFLKQETLDFSSLSASIYSSVRFEADAFSGDMKRFIKELFLHYQMCAYAVLEVEIEGENGTAKLELEWNMGSAEDAIGFLKIIRGKEVRVKSAQIRYFKEWMDIPEDFFRTKNAEASLYKQLKMTKSEFFRVRNEIRTLRALEKIEPEELPSQSL